MDKVLEAEKLKLYREFVEQLPDKQRVIIKLMYPSSTGVTPETCESLSRVISLSQPGVQSQHDVAIRRITAYLIRRLKKK